MKLRRIVEGLSLVCALVYVLNGVRQAYGQTILIDFGNDTSWRGLSMSNPDSNGNYWNSVHSDAFYPDLIDINGNGTTIDLGFDSAFGTDSYNGPAGVTEVATLLTDVLDTDIDAAALGNLGATNAAFDHYISSGFQIQGLDPTKTYDLTFFGSKKYEGDATTVYSVYTDATYSTLVDSVSLNVRNPGNPAYLHNRDTVATLGNVSPQTANSLYIAFTGSSGAAGYLSSMEIAANSGINTPPVASSGFYAVLEGGEIVIAAATLATDPDGDAVLFTSIGDTNPVDYGVATITEAGATLTYTNTSGAPGSTDLFSYSVSDGNGGSATNSIAIRIDPENGVSLLSAATDGIFAYLTYAAIPGTHYALDWTSSLMPPVDWQQMQVKLPLSNGVLRFTNELASPPTNSFFRVRSVVPEPVHGASLPYRTYEAEAGQFGGGATLMGPSMAEADTESEASGRQYVELTQTGAYVEWVVQEAAQGMVLRFTMPDAPGGGGTSATLGLYVNSSRVTSLALTSEFAWQYFPNPPATMDPSNDPATGRPRMRFDDVRHVLPSALSPGDVVRLQKDAQDTSASYGIDLVELEPIPDAIAAPPNSLDVTQPPYNAVPNDSSDDWSAFNACEADARVQGKIMYVPTGRFNLSQKWSINSVMVRGAGVWHSELHFTNPGSSGLRGLGGLIGMSDLHLTTVNTARAGSHGIGGYFGSGSLLSNLWSEHFVVGAWIADYSGANQITDGLTLSSCRFRNTYADGLNFAKGTRNSIVENTHFRNNGDDAMATWPSDVGTAPETINNTFRFNTVENTWRAAGLGIFGGRGHVAHDCLFRDVGGQAGIRFNTVFPGHPFSTSSEMVVSNMTLIRTSSTDLWGNQMGAVTFQTVNTPLFGIRLTSLEVVDSHRHGIFYDTANGQAITNVSFNTVMVTNSGQYGIYVKNGTGGWSENSFVTVTNSGSGAVWDFSVFDLRKIEGNEGW